ncbi:hypothetical protein WJX77_009416 [Trebouxia sp. C0004]
MGSMMQRSASDSRAGVKAKYEAKFSQQTPAGSQHRQGYRTSIPALPGPELQCHTDRDYNSVSTGCCVAEAALKRYLQNQGTAMRKKLKQFEQATVAGEKQNVCDSKTMRHAAQECRDWQAKFGGDDKLTFKTALDLLQAKGVLKPEDIKRKRIQHLLQQKELRSTTEDNDLSSESEYSSAASEPSPLCPYKRTQQGQLAQAKSQQQFTDNIQSGSLGDAVGDADSTVHQLEQGSVQAGFKPVNKDHPLQRVIMQHIDDMALFLLSEEGKAKKDSIYSVVCNPRHAVKPFLRDSDLDNLVQADGTTRWAGTCHTFSSNSSASERRWQEGRCGHKIMPSTLQALQPGQIGMVDLYLPHLLPKGSSFNRMLARRLPHQDHRTRLPMLQTA